MKPYQTLVRRLVHPKDAIPAVERSDVAYYVPCADCPATCVGETRRRLCKRIDEHKRAVQKADVGVSALAEHAWKTGHGVDWKGVWVLDSCHDLHRWLSLEACHIRRQPFPLSRDRGALPLLHDQLLTYM